jgi:hypothetical protein
MISRINWKLCLALFIFCLGGLALRILPILSDNVHFSFDQGLDILMVKQLVVDHKINLISRYSGLQGVLMGPLWTWLMAIPFTVSGGSPIANVIFLSILSILGSLTTFFLFKNILGTKTSLLLFILTLISPSFSGNTRVILSPNILIYIFSFYIFFLYQIFVLKKAIYWIPLLFIIGIFFQFEIAFAIFTVPPLFACLAIFHAWQTLKPKYLVLGFILGGITFLPQLIFDLRHHFIITNSLLGFIKGTNNSLYGESLPISVRVIERWRTLVGDFFEMALFVRPLYFQVATLALIVFGLARLAIDRAEKKAWDLVKISLTILVCFYGGFIFYGGAIWSWYRAGLPIVFVMLLTLSLSAIWKTKLYGKIIVVIFIIVCTFQNVPFSEINKAWKGQVGGGATLKTQKEIVDYIYQSSNGESFSYYVYTPPVYDYIWQYDFWWYGQKKYRRLPQNWQNSIAPLNIGTTSPRPTANQGLFFLIIEPDTDRPWAPNGWIETYIKVGKLLSQKTFPGNVMVQKRFAGELIQ